MYRVQLLFEKPQDEYLIFSIIDKKWKVASYNSFELFKDDRNDKEHYSISEGYTLFNIDDIFQFCKDKSWFNGLMNCNCDYCKKKTVGKYAVN